MGMYGLKDRVPSLMHATQQVQIYVLILSHAADERVQGGVG